MALAKRLIPCLDVDRGRVVKGVKFVSLRDAGDPVGCAARYDAEGADELVFLDITASSDARPIVLEMARRGAATGVLPFPAGGGGPAAGGADAPLGAGAGRGGSVAHLAKVLTEGKASAALAASVFRFGEIRLADAGRELRAAGVEVRG